MIGALLAAAICASLLALVRVRLASLGYAGGQVFAMVLLAGLQQLTALTTTVLPSLALALLSYAGAVSAAGFTRRQSARNVIMLGSSLSAAQVVSPIGMLLTAVLVPTLVAMKIPRSRAIGYFALLLFLPAASAGLLLLLARWKGIDASIFVHSALDGLIPVVHLVPSMSISEGLLRTALLFGIAAPIFPSQWRRSRFAVALVAGALIASSMAAAFVGRPYAFAMTMPSIASLQMVAATESGMPGPGVLLRTAATTVLCWGGSLVLA